MQTVGHATANTIPHAGGKEMRGALATGFASNKTVKQRRKEKLFKNRGPFKVFPNKS